MEDEASCGMEMSRKIEEDMPEDTLRQHYSTLLKKNPLRKNEGKVRWRKSSDLSFIWTQ